VRRLVALLIAAGMVIAAIVIRAQLDDDDEGTERTTTTDRQPRLVCATELAGVCDAYRNFGDDEIEVVEEAAGTTADRLVSEQLADLDAWLVTAPWPTIVDEARERKGMEPLFSAATPVARSPLVIVAQKDQLPADCADSFKCLAGRDGVSLGIGPAHEGAVSLAVLGQAVSSFTGRTDLSTSDLEDPAFDTWFASLARGVPPAAANDSDLVSTFLTQRGLYDAIGTTEAAANEVLGAAANRDEYVLTYPEPVATADVVFATVSRRIDVDGVHESVRNTCWRVAEGSSPCAGTTNIPAGSGLPPAGLLDALRGRWREATGQ
jgi:hypothetical protein